MKVKVKKKKKRLHKTNSVGKAFTTKKNYLYLILVATETYQKVIRLDYLIAYLMNHMLLSEELNFFMTQLKYLFSKQFSDLVIIIHFTVVLCASDICYIFIMYLICRHIPSFTHSFILSLSLSFSHTHTPFKHPSLRSSLGSATSSIYLCNFIT